MSKVDTSSWKAFKVGELFSCETTNSIPSKNNLTDGDISYITRSAVDNGLTGTCGNYESINAGRCITIGAEGFIAFWQPDDFVAGNKVYALRHDKLNEVNALFACAALNVLAKEYSFANARVLDNIKAETIMLPSTPDGSPDWAYMEQYMRQIMDKEETFAQHLASLTDEAAGERHVVDTSSWKAFKVGQLFETHMVGKKMCVPTGGMITQQALNDGNTPRITVSGIDNGVIGEFADVNSPNYRVYENFISVSFLGTVFYQEQRTSVDMKVHVLKCAELNRLRGLFLVSVIRASLMNCSYAQQISSSILPNLELTLPTTVDGSPDWAYMEEYMRQIMAREQIFADHLASFA